MEIYSLALKIKFQNVSDFPGLTSGFELYHRRRPSQTSCRIVVVNGDLGHVLGVRLELRDGDGRDVTHEGFRID